MAKKRKSASEEEAKPEPKIQKSLLSSSDDEGEEESESEEESDDEVEEIEEEENESSDSSESESSENEEEEEENEDSKLDNVKKLLEPFSKDQLIAILKEASQSNPSITTEVISAAESDPVHRKIFVHGLGWDCTNETLIAAFKPFGDIEECNVVTDKTSGRSKGYGFVLFKTRTAACKALKQPQKKIGSRMAACQLASTGPVQNQNQNQNPQGSDVSARKMYVANVGPQINPEKLRAFFGKFGEIEEGPLGFDKATGKFRGFAIFIYKTLEGIKKALEESFKVFDGVKLQCSIAVEGRSAKNNNINAATTQAPVTQTAVDMGANAMVMPGLALGLNPSAVLLGQNPAAFGVLNPMLGMGAGPYAGGVSQPMNSVGNAAIPVGLNPGFGLQPSVTSVNPNVMGSYGSHAPLQGLGAYPGYQLGQPSASAPGATAAASRPQTGTGPYFGR